VTTQSRVAALQAVLAAEHAVIYGYGVAGAHLEGAARRQAERGWTAHRARRDGLQERLSAAGENPAPPAPAYALPAPVDSERSARTLLALLEERLAAVWADAVGDLAGQLRGLAVDGLSDSAVAAAQWRGTSIAFPGLPERRL
jgi:hypothetical protein